MITISATTSKIEATAGAWVSLSPSTEDMIRTDATSVEYGRLPDSRISDPYSLIARQNDKAAPEVIADARLGRITILSVVNRLAPREAAASSTSCSSSRSTGCTVRTMKGNVTKRKAKKTATRVFAQLTPSGLDGP